MRELIQWLRDQRLFRQERQALTGLDDRMLRDIGITSDEAWRRTRSFRAWREEVRPHSRLRRPDAAELTRMVHPPVVMR
ncbi:DUF1127 domain-containing protein [Arhodomonas sp. AD133]|uniref:DUF1127 domain-containing protein n=1 Tax=Arhodomonas sp. AD133 TaxID=3415009 RepID=UPI003EB8E668